MARLASFSLTLVIPALLLLLAVRLVMTPLYLQIEYQRLGFPADTYGMTTTQRLQYAPLLLEYLMAGHPTHFLTDLKAPEGGALFNVREVGHLRDVQSVTQWAFGFAWIGGTGAVLSTFHLAGRDRRRLIQAVRSGALLAIGLIAAVAVSAVAAWDTFFTAFHRLFFAGGSWIFAYSDALIRLFPEQFWFDAALTVGGLTVLGAFGLLLIASALGRIKRA